MCRVVLIILIPLTAIGCGGGLKKFPTVKVSGKVRCEGQPVPNVLVNFAPLSAAGPESGKMGVGVAKSDGTFTVSTYGDGDGAVVGKHDVSVSSPHPEDFPDFTCNCETNGNKKPIVQVDVTASGENSFTINLPPKTARSKPNISKEDLEDIKQSTAGN